MVESGIKDHNLNPIDHAIVCKYEFHNFQENESKM
jgi:hypothetical protein